MPVYAADTAACECTGGGNRFQRQLRQQPNLGAGLGRCADDFGNGGDEFLQHTMGVKSFGNKKGNSKKWRDEHWGLCISGLQQHDERNDSERREKHWEQGVL